MDHSDETEEYAGGEIREYTSKKIPSFMYLVYILVLLIGLIWFYYFWNGSRGALDPGYWHDLEKAAKTTYPYHSSESR